MMAFDEVCNDELREIDGGLAISTVCVLASGGCYIAAGIASLCGNSKASAWFTIAGGCCDVAAGVCMLLP